VVSGQNLNPKLSVSNFKKGVIFSNLDNHSTQVNITVCIFVKPANKSFLHRKGPMDIPDNTGSAFTVFLLKQKF
jgi:hypothetical protein